MPYKRVHPLTPFGRFIQTRQDELEISTESLSARWRRVGSWYGSKVNALKMQPPGAARPIFLPWDAVGLGAILQVSPIVLQALYLQNKEFPEEIDWEDPNILKEIFSVYWDVMRLLPEEDQQEVIEYMLLRFSKLPESVRRQAPVELQQKSTRSRGLASHPAEHVNRQSHRKKPGGSSGESASEGERETIGENRR